MTKNNSLNNFSETLNTTGDITLAAGNVNLPNTTSTTGMITFGTNSWIHNYGTANTFVGQGAGNKTLTVGNATDNTAVGFEAMISLTVGTLNTGVGMQALNHVTSGERNTGLGFQASSAITTGSSNTCFGYGALNSNQTSDFNSAIGTLSLQSATGGNNVGLGYQTLANVVAGTGNIGIGIQAGILYTAGNSNNIAIGTLGMNGDSGVMRIGTSGTHVKAFISGVTGTVPDAAYVNAVVDSNGQLGASPIAFLPSYTAKAFANSPYTVLATDYFISLDTSGGAITIKLPNAPTTNRIIYIKDRTGNAGANNISVTTVDGAVNIDGVTTYALSSNYAHIGLIFNGTSYEIF